MRSVAAAAAGAIPPSDREDGAAVIAGFTAGFAANWSARMNRELGAEIDLDPIELGSARCPSGLP